MASPPSPKVYASVNLPRFLYCFPTDIYNGTLRVIVRIYFLYCKSSDATSRTRGVLSRSIVRHGVLTRAPTRCLTDRSTLLACTVRPSVNWQSTHGRLYRGGMRGGQLAPCPSHGPTPSPAPSRRLNNIVVTYFCQRISNYITVLQPHYKTKSGNAIVCRLTFTLMSGKRLLASENCHCVAIIAFYHISSHCYS